MPMILSKIQRGAVPNFGEGEPRRSTETWGRRTGCSRLSRFSGFSGAAILFLVSSIAGLAGCAELRPEAPPLSVPISASEPATPRFAPILFGSGSVDLSIQARKQIRGMAADLRHPKNDGRVIVIEGYSDSKGSAERNLQISRERAEAVARELVFNGLSRDRIRIEAYGEERPTQPNTDEHGEADTQGQAANRRVEVYLSK